MNTTTQPTSVPAGQTANGQGKPRIAVPWIVHWRRSRYRIVPILVFGAAVFGMLTLWQRQGSRHDSVGEITGMAARVVSPADGILLSLDGKGPGIYDRVTAGQIVARLRKGSSETSAIVDITAPISGKLLSIRRLGGQRVHGGDVLMTIATEQGRYVTTYIQPDGALRPELGMAVDVRLRSSPRKTAVARVDRVGPQIEQVPEHQLHSGKSKQWGIPVILSLPAGFEARPGELVDLTFRSGDKATGYVPAPVEGFELMMPAGTGDGSRGESH